MRRFADGRLAIPLAMLAFLLLASVAWTQGANDTSEQDDSGGDASEAAGFDSDRDEFDEIVVTPGRPGDSISVQTKYDELLRNRLLKDIDTRRALEEEYEWRKSDTANVDGPVRIRWGYDARDDLKLREEADLAKHEYDVVRPATIFSVEF